MKTVDVRKKILAANEEAAGRLRDWFSERETLVVNLISSPGSGKTTLLEASIPRLKGDLQVGVMVGDVATERDAARLARLNVPARQLITGGSCHLDARLVDRHLQAEEALQELDILFVENVGNLICPTSYDLGEDYKVVLLSTTEGADKPLKYPGIFSKAAVCVITKMDLIAHTDFDLETAREELVSLNPATRIFETSARTGSGLDDWCHWLRSRLIAKRSSEFQG